MGKINKKKLQDGWKQFIHSKAVIPAIGALCLVIVFVWAELAVAEPDAGIYRLETNVSMIDEKVAQGYELCPEYEVILTNRGTEELTGLAASSDEFILFWEDEDGIRHYIIPEEKRKSSKNLLLIANQTEQTEQVEGTESVSDTEAPEDRMHLPEKLAVREEIKVYATLPLGYEIGKVKGAILFSAEELEEPVKVDLSIQIVDSLSQNSETDELLLKSDVTVGKNEVEPADAEDGTEADPDTKAETEEQDDTSDGSAAESSDADAEDDPEGTTDATEPESGQDDTPAGESAGSSEADSDGVLDQTEADASEAEPGAGTNPEDGSGDSETTESTEAVEDTESTENTGETETEADGTAQDPEDGANTEEPGTDDAAEDASGTVAVPEGAPVVTVVNRSGGYVEEGVFYATSKQAYYEFRLQQGTDYEISKLICRWGDTVSDIMVGDDSFTVPLPANIDVRLVLSYLDPNGAEVVAFEECVVNEQTAPQIGYERYTSENIQYTRIVVSETGIVRSGIKQITYVVDGAPVEPALQKIQDAMIVSSGMAVPVEICSDLALPVGLHDICVTAQDYANNITLTEFQMNIVSNEIVNVVVPTTFDMVVYPDRTEDQIWGENIVVTNRSEFPVDVFLRKTVVSLKRNEGEKKTCSLFLDVMMNRGLKKRYDLPEGETRDVFSFQLGAKDTSEGAKTLKQIQNSEKVTSDDYAIVKVGGSLDENDNAEWHDKDLKVKLVFDFRKHVE